MFYVNQTEFARLSGRTKQGITKARNEGRLPDARTDEDKPVFDVDHELCRKFLSNLPNNLGQKKKEAIRDIQREFAIKRADGTLKCVKTGYADLMGEVDSFLPPEDDEALDRKKKVVEIQHKEKQIEKLDVGLMALRGGLIEREYVTTWTNRYIGAIHTQILGLSASGLCDDLYNIAHVNKNSKEAIKEMEKKIAVAGSEILKGAIASMEANPI